VVKKIKEVYLKKVVLISYRGRINKLFYIGGILWK